MGGELIVKAEVMNVCNDIVIMDFRAQQVEKLVKRNSVNYNNSLIVIPPPSNSIQYLSCNPFEGFFRIWTIRSLFGYF